jgi:hypothetical protein
VKTTVIHHSADFDGLFCREIARRFLPDAELIGWDFGDKPLPYPAPADVTYILDLPCDRPFGVEFKDGWVLRDKDPIQPLDRWDKTNYIWIDHHKSSIETHPTDIPGYRIDGVAACRLAWQWFKVMSQKAAGAGDYSLAPKWTYLDRQVQEPIAVRLAGEYDIWDKRDPNAERFQHGLRSEELFQVTWDALLDVEDGGATVIRLLNQGRALQYTRGEEYREVITQQGFELRFEGLTFLACNSHELDIRSQLFAAAIKPHHDALMGFTFSGRDWRVSIYNPPDKDNDMSVIAKRHGGGGHRGASGFRCSSDKMLAILSEVPF